MATEISGTAQEIDAAAASGSSPDSVMAPAPGHESGGSQDNKVAASSGDFREKSALEAPPVMPSPTMSKAAQTLLFAAGLMRKRGHSDTSATSRAAAQSKFRPSGASSLHASTHFPVPAMAHFQFKATMPVLSLTHSKAGSGIPTSQGGPGANIEAFSEFQIPSSHLKQESASSRRINRRNSCPANFMNKDFGSLLDVAGAFHSNTSSDTSTQSRRKRARRHSGTAMGSGAEQPPATKRRGRSPMTHSAGPASKMAERGDSGSGGCSFTGSEDSKGRSANGRSRNSKVKGRARGRKRAAGGNASPGRRSGGSAQSPAEVSIHTHLRRERNRNFEVQRRQRVSLAMKKLKELVIPTAVTSKATKITILEYAIQALRKLQGEPAMDFEQDIDLGDDEKLRAAAQEAGASDVMRAVRERRRRIRTNKLEQELARLAMIGVSKFTRESATKADILESARRVLAGASSATVGSGDNSDGIKPECVPGTI